MYMVLGWGAFYPLRVVIARQKTVFENPFFVEEMKVESIFTFFQC